MNNVWKMYISCNLYKIVISFLVSLLFYIPLIENNINHFYFFIIGAIGIILIIYYVIETLIIFKEVKNDITDTISAKIVKVKVLRNLFLSNKIYGFKIKVIEDKNKCNLYYYFSNKKIVSKDLRIKINKNLDCVYYSHSYIIKECKELRELVKRNIK